MLDLLYYSSQVGDDKEFADLDKDADPDKDAAGSLLQAASLLIRRHSACVRRTSFRAADAVGDVAVEVAEAVSDEAGSPRGRATGEPALKWGVSQRRTSQLGSTRTSERKEAADTAISVGMLAVYFYQATGLSSRVRDQIMAVHQRTRAKASPAQSVAAMNRLSRRLPDDDSWRSTLHRVVVIESRLLFRTSWIKYGIGLTQYMMVLILLGSLFFRPTATYVLASTCFQTAQIVPAVLQTMVAPTLFDELVVRPCLSPCLSAALSPPPHRPLTSPWPPPPRTRFRVARALSLPIL